MLFDELPADFEADDIARACTQVAAVESATAGTLHAFGEALNRRGVDLRSEDDRVGLLLIADALVCQLLLGNEASVARWGDAALGPMIEMGDGVFPPLGGSPRVVHAIPAGPLGAADRPRTAGVTSAAVVVSANEMEMSNMDREPVGSGEAVLVRSGRTYEGRQGLTYGEGVFAENTGARKLCLHVLRIPPGGRAKAHLHASHETAIYLIDGAVSVLHGQGLRHRTEMEAGDYLYIPTDCPHVPVNTGSTEAFAVLARTDPNEQESVVLLPSLEQVVEDRLA